MQIIYSPIEEAAKTIRMEYHLNKNPPNQKFQEKKELGQRNQGNGEQTQTQKNINGTGNSRFLGNVFCEKKEYRMVICY